MSIATSYPSEKVRGIGPTPEQVEKKGLLWLVGSFVFCPCHLPLTLGVAAMLLGGTALGAVLRAHPVVAGSIVTIVWVAGTWRGIHILKSARTCRVTPGKNKS